MVRRVAGFDAVRMLDADAQYRRAFDLARHVHDTTGAAFDVEGMLADAVGQAAMLERLGKPPAARARPVSGVALVVGMPRSGTTLLEQMLDRHPDITGIGEFDGISTMGTAIVGMGLWPRDLPALDTASAQELQRDYCDGASLTRRSGTRWTFDKSLHTWRWLPAVAAVLPGAACIRIERDARDTAISLYLSNFHPQSFGWTRSLESIRRVISAERALAPLAMRALGIPHEDIRYEDLVQDPRGHMERVLKLLGLPWHDAVPLAQLRVRVRSRVGAVGAASRRPAHSVLDIGTSVRTMFVPWSRSSSKSGTARPSCSIAPSARQSASSPATLCRSRSAAAA